MVKSIGTKHLEKEKQYNINKEDLINLNYFDLEFN